VAYRDYVFLVPSVKEDPHYFLKTIIPAGRRRETTSERKAEMKKLDRYERGILSAYDKGGTLVSAHRRKRRSVHPRHCSRDLPQEPPGQHLAFRCRSARHSGTSA